MTFLLLLALSSAFVFCIYALMYFAILWITKNDPD